MVASSQSLKNGDKHYPKKSAFLGCSYPNTNELTRLSHSATCHVYPYHPHIIYNLTLNLSSRKAKLLEECCVGLNHANNDRIILNTNKGSNRITNLLKYTFLYIVIYYFL